MTDERITISPFKTGKRWDHIVFGHGVLIARLNLGNGATYKVLACRPEGGKLFLGIEGQGCYSFPTANFISPPEAMRRFKLYAEDTNNITDWLNAQIYFDAVATIINDWLTNHYLNTKSSNILSDIDKSYLIGWVCNQVEDKAQEYGCYEDNLCIDRVEGNYPNDSELIESLVEAKLSIDIFS